MSRPRVWLGALVGAAVVLALTAMLCNLQHDAVADVCEGLPPVYGTDC